MFSMLVVFYVPVVFKNQKPNHFIIVLTKEIFEKKYIRLSTYTQ